MVTDVKVCSLLLLTLWFYEPCFGGFTTTDANKIHSAIFGASYNHLVRPSEFVNVNIEFFISSINSVDMKNQILSLSGWLAIKWNDSRLIWTPGTYGDIGVIYTAPSKIWKPEVVVQNSVTGIEIIGQEKMLYRVKNTGDVHWDPPGVYNVHCEMDVTYFPFDYQTCSLQVTSWVYGTDKVNFTQSTDYVNTEDYNKNGEWQLYSTSVTESIRTEEEESFSTLNFAVTLKRRSGYYLSQIIFPVLVVSFLTNITFLLPHDSGEKTSFILTVLLSLAVLLTLVGESIPTTSLHTSILAVYLSLVLALSGLVILITVLNLRFYLRVNQKDIPIWLKHLTKCVLIPCYCRGSKVETSLFTPENSNTKKVTDFECTSTDSVHLKEKTSERNHHQEIKDDAHTFERDPDFPYLCRDVSRLIDLFFFNFFMVLNVLLTVAFMGILSAGSQPEHGHHS